MSIIDLNYNQSKNLSSLQKVIVCFLLACKHYFWLLMCEGSGESNDFIHWSPSVYFPPYFVFVGDMRRSKSTPHQIQNFGPGEREPVYSWSSQIFHLKDDFLKNVFVFIWKTELQKETEKQISSIPCRIPQMAEEVGVGPGLGWGQESGPSLLFSVMLATPHKSCWTAVYIA